MKTKKIQIKPEDVQLEKLWSKIEKENSYTKKKLFYRLMYLQKAGGFK